MRAYSHFLNGPVNWSSSGRQLHMPASSTAHWLFLDGSLTRHLKRLCIQKGAVFNIQLLGQHRRFAFPDEQQLVQTSGKSVCLIREVVLRADTVPLVLARTVIPLQALTGAYRRLSWLKTKSLGSILFGYPEPHRTLSQLTMIGGEQIRPEFDLSGNSIWGRRNRYDLQGHTLLVAEFFLPQLISLSNEGCYA